MGFAKAYVAKQIRGRRKPAAVISVYPLAQQLFHISGFQYLAHGNHLLVDHNSRHAHYAVCHDFFHIGDVFHLNRKPHGFDSGFGILVLLVAGFAACAQHFDAADTVHRCAAAAGCRFLCLRSRAAAAF